MRRIISQCMLMTLAISSPLFGQMDTSSGSGATNEMNKMDHGPFVSSTITYDPLSTSNIMTYKGIAVKVGDAAAPATMVFDTDLLRVASGWTGGFLHWYEARNSLEEFPSPGGFESFTTSQGPGWSRTGSFEDPRRWPYGPLPDEWGRYEGLYIHDDRVVFSYALGTCNVLESFGFSHEDEAPIFTRTFELTETNEALSLRLLHAPEGPQTRLEQTRLPDGKGYIRIQSGTESRFIGYRGLPDSSQWRIADHHLILDLPPLRSATQFEISISPVRSGSDPTFITSMLQEMPAAVQSLQDLTQPGPARWEMLETTAVTSDSEGPFVQDELTLPLTNPWNSYLRLSGVDFLSDGRAAIASLSGDVWLVSGIGEILGTLTWKRYATGLNQPLGLKVVEDQIYVTGRDQITRLHDLNGDDEADFYENFNNEVMAATNFHAFTLNLETDAEGNFYFAKATPWPPMTRGEGPERAAEITPHHGVLFKLSPDGKDLEIVATGLRNPNGLAISPEGEMVYPDNQGNWVPTSNVVHIKEGGFHGFVPSAHQTEVPDEPIHPVLWIPHFVDNSPGSPVWITSDTWPEEIQGDLMLTSYGRANLSLLMKEEVAGVMQGALVNLPLSFRSGTMRGRFHQDGHLYIVGLTSWQSLGEESGSFHRVRYTGQPLYLPVDVHVKHNGVHIQFSDKLDESSATELTNYQIQQWNYRWIEGYGSPMYSVANPEEQGLDMVDIQSVQLTEDKKTIFLEIPAIQPVMSMSIKYTIMAEDGTELENEIFTTINKVPAHNVVE